MKKEIKKLLALIVIAMLALNISACSSVRSNAKSVDLVKSQKEGMIIDNSDAEVLEKTEINEIEDFEEELTSPPEDKVATIVSVGDTLAHTSVYEAAYNSSLGTYDFSPMFKHVKKYFKKATAVVANSESPFAGPERGYSGYPCFNCPEQLATDLKELGVDVLTTANNHCLDKGYDGLCSTLDYMDKAGIKHVGTSRSSKEQNKIVFKDLNGIKTAFLSYTYGTNGIPVPQGKEYCVNYINKDLILNQLKKAKKEGAECIVVSMHWGVEYQTIENSEQDELAEFLVAHGVNIVLGCHPHVLQPMKMLKTKTPKGKKKEGLVIFSQGNFFSGQTKENTNNTAIFKIKIKKDGKTNKVSVEKATYVPIYVKNNGRGAACRYELLDVENIVKSHEKKGKWSEDIYQLALRERNRCYELIGPEIDNTKR